MTINDLKLNSIIGPTTLTLPDPLSTGSYLISDASGYASWNNAEQGNLSITVGSNYKDLLLQEVVATLRPEYYARGEINVSIRFVDGVWSYERVFELDSINALLKSDHFRVNRVMLAPIIIKDPRGWALGTDGLFELRDFGLVDLVKGI